MSAVAVLRAANPELEILLTCARASIDSDALGRIRILLNQRLDWRKIFTLALEHGVAPLLFASLARTEAGTVPSGVMHALELRSRAVAQHNLLQVRELHRLVAEMNAAGIPVLPFKGVVLAATLYGDLALRESSDLDLLVPPEHVDRASRLLSDLGYTPWYDLQAGQEHAYQQRWHARAFGNRQLGIGVDLHWRFADLGGSFGIPPARAWAEAIDTSFPGGTIRTLSPQLHLLVLCAHGARHQEPWARLKWVCDIGELIRAHPEMDWDKVLGDARSRGCERTVLLGAALASELLDVALPTPFRSRVEADTRLMSLVPWIAERLLDPDKAPILLRERIRFDLQIRERNRDRARYLIRRVAGPTRRDWEWVTLPRSLSFLYPALRFTRLVGSRFPLTRKNSHGAGKIASGRQNDAMSLPDQGSSPKVMVR